MDSSTNSLDEASADGSTDYQDRTSMMEVRLQAQEDEITLLKSSLADALRRIHIHDKLLPLLKQQLIAVNPSAARVLNQVSCSESSSSSRRFSSSAAVDGIPLSAGSPSQPSHNIVNSANGHTGSPAAAELQSRPASRDQSTQTEPTPSALEPDQNTLPPNDKSLDPEGGCLCDQTLPNESRVKLVRVPGLEDEEEDDEDQQDEGGEQEKELSLTSSMEESVQSDLVRGLQREDSHDGSCSSEEPGSSSASLSSSTQNLSSRSGPLSTIQEGEKTLCVTFARMLANQKNLFLVAWL